MGKMKKTLCNGRRACKPIDMGYVYRQIELGRSVQEIAKELGVSRSTLYRRHEQEQQKEELREDKDPFWMIDEG